MKVKLFCISTICFLVGCSGNLQNDGCVTAICKRPVSDQSYLTVWISENMRTYSNDSAVDYTRVKVGE
ncbi:hypothetical protein BGP75_24035 [Motiliproteus sp. MSK22-1]|nr:hypothetical protein BGP75_24035 [Motiliproteus sp. MSK22-1]